MRELEFVRATSNNTWGLGISEEGLIFGSTANGNPSNFMPIPNRYYEVVKGWSPSTLEMISDTYKFAAITDKVRQVDSHGGYTAAAGHALYTARKYPQSWWNRIAFVCEPTGHLVGSFVLNSDGAAYKSRNSFNLMASDDEWASPIMAEVGPDGSVWVSDWYNYIVQHNPTPLGFTTGKGNAYETDLRDKVHGRIYRVVYEGDGAKMAPAAEAASRIASKGLGQASSLELVEALAHPTMRCRLVAQHLLLQKSALEPAAINALLKTVANPAVDEIGLNTAAMHAIWTLKGLQLIDPQRQDVWVTVTRALRHPSRGVRRSALAALPANAATVQACLANGVMEDPDPQVALAGLLKLADTQPVGETLESSIATILARPRWLTSEDRWLLDAWTCAVAPRPAAVLAKLSQANLGSSPQFARRLAIVAEHWARSRPNSQEVNGLILMLSQASPDVGATVLGGITGGWPSDHAIKLDSKADTAMLGILERLPAGSRSSLVQWGSMIDADSIHAEVGKIAQQLASVVTEESASPKERIDAAKQWIGLLPKTKEVIDQVLASITPQMPTEVAVGLVSSLAGSKSERVAPGLLENLVRMTPVVREAAIRVLLARRETTQSLLDAMQKGQLTLADLTLDQRQSLRDHPDKDVRELAVKLMQAGGGVPSADRAKVIEDWLVTTEKEGDVSRGKEMFKKHCAACHRHQGEGQNIGPDLSGMAAHPKSELLTNILDPNRSVEGNFRTYLVLTSDGLVVTGMLAGESRTSIELINAQGKRQSIQREDIEKLTASSKSLMPEGFEGQMNRDEMADLLEFLATKGRFVPLPFNGVANAISTKPLYTDDANGPDRMIFSDWSPKTFQEVPFVLVDPQESRIPNIILLNGPMGTLPPRMPKAVQIPCALPAKAIHLLSGVSGWGFPYHQEKSVSMTVRLHFEDGTSEDHPLVNGEHFADYIRKVDVPASKFAYSLNGQQIRYLRIECQQQKMLKEVEFLKGDDITAPIIMAATIETNSDH